MVTAVALLVIDVAVAVFGGAGGAKDAWHCKLNNTNFKLIQFIMRRFSVKQGGVTDRVS